jgi:hypothetical protein
MLRVNHVRSFKLICLLACLALALTGQVHAQGVDNPLPLKLGATYKANLFENEENHLQISLPAGEYKIILDARRHDGKSGNIIGKLSILNSNGTISKAPAISLNALDVAHREVSAFRLKTPTTFILKLENQRYRLDYWLTVLKNSSSLLPFFDELTPKPIKLGQSESGTLDPREFVYFTTRLTRGDYNVTLDFETVSKKRTNITGYFATLDENGGSFKKLLTFNSLDQFSRMTGTFGVRAETMMIFKVECGNYSSVNYKLTIEPTAQ